MEAKETPEQATSAAELVEAAIAETNRAREQEVATLRARLEAATAKVARLKAHVGRLQEARRFRLLEAVVKGQLAGCDGAWLTDEAAQGQEQDGMIRYADALYSRWLGSLEHDTGVQREDVDLEAPTAAVLAVAARHGNIAEPMRSIVNAVCPPPENG